MDASQVQSQMAGHLIESVLGQAQNAQVDLAMKMARISLQTQLQSPPSVADVTGMGSSVDVVG
jgi:hypothetical protein